MAIEAANTTTDKGTAQKVIIVGMFTGMLKGWQATAFRDLVQAGVDRYAAHKICNDYAADLGRAMSADGKFSSKIGKLDLEGNRKIGMTAKANIQCSDAMSVVFVAQTMDALFKDSLLAERKLPKLSSNLEEYLITCTDWASEQNWKDMKKEEQS